MQPAFPPDHHFHFRSRSAEANGLREPGTRHWRSGEIASAAQHGIAYLSRQVMPAFDGSDPRDHPLAG